MCKWTLQELGIHNGENPATRLRLQQASLSSNEKKTAQEALKHFLILCLPHFLFVNFQPNSDNNLNTTIVFTALHGMQMRSSDENSVRLSVTRVHCDKTVERSVNIYIPYERSFSLVFWEEWLVEVDPIYLKFWVNRPQLERNRRFSTNNRS